jgi:hypothetical protein
MFHRPDPFLIFHLRLTCLLFPLSSFSSLPSPVISPADLVNFPYFALCFAPSLQMLEWRRAAAGRCEARGGRREKGRMRVVKERGSGDSGEFPVKNVRVRVHVTAPSRLCPSGTVRRWSDSEDRVFHCATKIIAAGGLIQNRRDPVWRQPRLLPPPATRTAVARRTDPFEHAARSVAYATAERERRWRYHALTRVISPAIRRQQYRRLHCVITATRSRQHSTQRVAKRHAYISAGLSYQKNPCYIARHPIRTFTD